MTASKIDPRARAADLVEAGVRAGTPGARRIGLVLAAQRTQRGESRAETAKKVGVSESVYGSWERGTTVPGARSMLALRRWLGKDGSDRLDLAIAQVGRTKDADRATEPGAGTEAARTPGTGPAPAPARKRKAAVPEGRMTPDEALLTVLIESSLPPRAKALLSAAIVALAAGIDVEIEVRSRV